MATIPKNLPWHDKREVKKGDYGEVLVRRILEQCGFVVYQAVTDTAHGIDFIIERDKDLIFAVEVKTKPKFANYPATGFDFRHYVSYRNFSERAHMPVLIVFVDQSQKAIYGNFLHVLDEPRTYCRMNYPGVFKRGNTTIRYYPLNAMLPIGILSDRDVAFLSQHSATHY